MDTVKFNNKEEFAKYIKTQAHKIISEEKTRSLGNPADFKMNQNDGSENSTGAKVETKEKGFKTKTEAPANIPKEFKTTKNPIDVNMEERDGGHDEEISTASKIEGTKSQKGATETNPFIKGQVKPNVESKKSQPNVSVDADPTKEGGIPGKKDNDIEINKEDKEDKSEMPMTQVLRNGEISKDGFSKGQIAKIVNAQAKNETDTYEEKLRNSIKTIQLPERFENKKALNEFIKREAIRISKII